MLEDGRFMALKFVRIIKAIFMIYALLDLAIESMTYNSHSLYLFFRLDSPKELN